MVVVYYRPDLSTAVGVKVASNICPLCAGLIIICIRCHGSMFSQHCATAMFVNYNFVTSPLDVLVVIIVSHYCAESQHIAD
jgi:hypothetical protein